MSKWICLCAVVWMGINVGCESDKQYIDSFEKECLLSGGKFDAKEQLCKCEDVKCPNNIKCVRGDGNQLKCGECVAGTFACLDENKNAENGEFLWVCKEADDRTTSWERINECHNSCVPPQKDNEIATCGECINNNKRCSKNENGNDIVEVCKNGLYSVIDECIQLSCTEVETDGKSDAYCGVCKNYDTKCENNEIGNGEIYKCKDGAWEKDNTQTCSNFSCKNDEILGKMTCGECFNGSMRCWENKETGSEVVQTCEGGIYKQTSDCESNSCIPPTDSSPAKCGECKNGDTRCIPESEGVRGIPQTCKNAKWENDIEDNKPFCTNQTSCISNSDGTSKCGECQNNVSTCIDDNNIGYTNYCKNGRFEKHDNEKCPMDFSCKSDEIGINSCGDCLNGTHEFRIYECTGDVQETSDECTPKAFSFIDLDTLKLCAKSSNELECIRNTHKIACSAAACENDFSGKDCKMVVDDCYKNKPGSQEPYGKCGFSLTSYFFSTSIQKCEEGMCKNKPGCESCIDGQYCYTFRDTDEHCFNADQVEVVAFQDFDNIFYTKCLADGCSCGSDKCKKEQYCKNDSICIDKQTAEASANVNKMYHELVKSWHYKCNSTIDCFHGLNTYLDCIKASYSNYETCIKCENEDNIQECLKQCADNRILSDNACYDAVKNYNVYFTPSCKIADKKEDDFTKDCRYECISGQIQPFDSVNGCK